MLDELANSLVQITEQTKANSNLLAIILVCVWLFYLLSLFNQKILLLGIRPRYASGLPGIVFAPLLHADFNHIFFNSIPLVVLSNFLLISGLDYYLQATIFITLLSGVLIWCFAKPGLHIGASAIITGYWGLLVFDVYQQGSLTAIVLGIISLYYFAGIFFGIFPMKKGVSWEGHLFGLLSGIAFSYFYPAWHTYIEIH
tara:strand:- start:2293 stop:2889 length:597 start_codon:yes stop_codon:yes gene_type:complete